MTIRSLTYKELDLTKWDKCIDASINGTIFGYSWYLNLVCENWEAIVLDDYEAIMPLPIGKKLNHPVVEAPCLVPQLGVFSPRLPGPETIDTFLAYLRANYRYIKIGLNKFNLLSDEKFKIKAGRSFTLDLIPSYAKLRNHFAYGIRKKIEAAQSEKFSVMKGMQLEEFIRFKKNLTGRLSIKADEMYYNKLRRLISFTILHRFGDLYGVYSGGNNLSAAMFVIPTPQRITCLVGARSNDEEGDQAFLILMDHIIEKYSESNYTMHLEILPFYTAFKLNIKSKSQVRNQIQYLFSTYPGLGAKLYNYPIIVYDNLPWYAKITNRFFPLGPGARFNIQI